MAKVLARHASQEMDCSFWTTEVIAERGDLVDASNESVIIVTGLS